MRNRVLLFIALIIAALQAQAAVITASVEQVDFGPVEIGYPVSMQFTVTGSDLTGDIDLTLDGRHTHFYQVTPAVITPEAAATGATVTVKCLPVSAYIWPVDLVLSSPGAQDVTVGLTADPFYPAELLINNQRLEFTASVGQIVGHWGTIRFADAEIPTDPNQPVVRNHGGLTLDAIGPNAGDVYSLVIDGADSNHFTARIAKSSAITNICTVAINYAPRAIGSHDATLTVYCKNAGVPTVTIKLHGEAQSVLGDLSGDGLLDITDVVSMIGLLQLGEPMHDLSDINSDGVFNISDVTITINKLLGN